VTDLGSPLTAIPSLFLAGVLTSLTPCIYPMIPITAAVVGGGSADAGARRARPAVLALVYALGLSLVYSTLGLIASLSGAMFGSVSSSPWASLAMGNLLLVAALAMLDVIPVRMPAFLVQRAAGAGTGGRIGGALVMGAVSGLVAAPCSAPVMVTVLAWVSRTHSAARGFVYLFAFSLGMCAILIAVGFSAGAAARLPRAGSWMLWIKRLFALIMFGMAEYYFVLAGQAWI
jgi:thiol:disulfide interchange protein DsbD